MLNAVLTAHVNSGSEAETGEEKAAIGHVGAINAY